MNLSMAIRIVAMVSIITGIIVATVSSWSLHRAMQALKNPTKTTAEDLLYQVNMFFGGTTGLYDLDVIFRILIACSATALAGGFMQFIMSFLLLVAAARGDSTMAMIWVYAQVVILLAIGGSFLCILTNDLQVKTALQVFLPITGIDSLLLIGFCWVVLNYIQSDGDEAGSLSGGTNRHSFDSRRAHATEAGAESQRPSEEPPIAPRKERRAAKEDEVQDAPMQTDF